MYGAHGALDGLRSSQSPPSASESLSEAKRIKIGRAAEIAARPSSHILIALLPVPFRMLRQLSRIPYSRNKVKDP